MRFVVPEDEIPVFTEEEAFPLGRAQAVQFQAKISLPETAQCVPLDENEFIKTSKRRLREAIWEFLEKVLPPVPPATSVPGVAPTFVQEYWFHGGQWARPGPPARQSDEATRDMNLDPYKFAIIGYRVEICEKGFEVLDSHLSDAGTLQLDWGNSSDEIKVIFTQRDVSCNGKELKI